jgi:hypothetical protein
VPDAIWSELSNEVFDLHDDAPGCASVGALPPPVLPVEASTPSTSIATAPIKPKTATSFCHVRTSEKAQRRPFRAIVAAGLSSLAELPAGDFRSGSKASI